MEILSYVLSGALSPKDSEGNTGVIRNGDGSVLARRAKVWEPELSDTRSEVLVFDLA